ncbi:hypothetical protein [Xenophilus sp. Marseille-Q4582]|uniref:hypothetical protein n=1 Tax=Xenophilus sp. Marseille-Q4582 TaxID=2866600 RepID=UPI001CE48148|nr:hypothetical protein [Xenophilus sp. Marseille-Q4582]
MTDAADAVSRAPAAPAAAPRSLPLSADERASLMRAGALALDAAGREVLMGLSAAQSQQYLDFVRRPTQAPEDLARHQALTLQLERARLRRSAEAPDHHSAAALQAAMNA